MRRPNGRGRTSDRHALLPTPAPAMHPTARVADLVVQPMAAETMVYDLDARTYHLLHPVAAAVFRAADGTRDVAALADAVGATLGAPVDGATVEAALAGLGDARLLAAPVAAPTSPGRREALRRLGLAAGGLAAAALVTSIAAPSPAMAQSGGPVFPV